MKRFRSLRGCLREKHLEDKYGCETETTKKRFIETHVKKLPPAPEETRPSKRKNTSLS